MSAKAEDGKVVSFPLTIRNGDVLHFLGYPEGQRPVDRIERMVNDTIGAARSLVAPRGVFVRHPVERSDELGLEPLEATALVVGLVTIGGELERRTAQFVANGEPTRALLMDAAGSAAVEEAADRLGATIVGEKEKRSSESTTSHVSCRISPGYGSWSIHAQEALFEILPHRIIGVSLLPTMLMTPRKSISFAMWLGADRRPLAGLAGCARCGLVECRYRREKSLESE